jgi:hypothetical protein
MTELVFFLMIFNIAYTTKTLKEVEDCEGKVKECRVVSSVKDHAETSGAILEEK